ncbi:efflux RND transporter periplasmic adaptor subunit [Marinomonas sp. M1K-6]|uniref:Efflux RND transporter periplasmic adaptor subunit n=1 Tax=Marinomonas profundi TaxID=2726122 RepID=A0A847R7G3_9GAMM|nr:efflux RND transporter periplasmic adaptor subunit [Marinomonas profundi]NLQ18026.1 efflux RND transporter periplasmic adaptor subunit [Marinomonas profundi]UDV01748.1 efflux RND transporter periplasmic adaptor subunit [Marinomonas profundi]
MIRILKNGRTLLPALVVLLIVSGCTPSEPEAQVSSPASARAATVMAVQPVEYEENAILPGRVEPIREAEVRARVPGIVLHRKFVEGSDVKAGDVLFEIDPASLKIALARAKGELARAEATVFDAKVLVDRYAPLLESQAVSKQVFDAAQAAYLSANAAVISAKADVDNAELNLDYATVRAPISGRIGRANVSEGMLVGQGDTTLLATIQQLDPVYIDFTQSVTDSLKYQQSVEERAATNSTILMAKLDGYNTFFEGELLFSDSQVDEKTGNVVLRGLFPNPNAVLLPGMYVRVKAVQSHSAQAILIPQRAVMRGHDGRAFVYVVNDQNTVESRPVETGSMAQNLWRITEGLQAEEKVIIDNAAMYQAGEKVTTSVKLASNS